MKNAVLLIVQGDRRLGVHKCRQGFDDPSATPFPRFLLLSLTANHRPAVLVVASDFRKIKCPPRDKQPHRATTFLFLYHEDYVG